MNPTEIIRKFENAVALHQSAIREAEERLAAARKEAEEAFAGTVPPKPKGRPKGSRNKPKAEVEQATL